MTDYPDDADGNALRNIEEQGSDMSRPMDVDIQVAAPDELTAIEIANAAMTFGYRTETYFDDDLEDAEEATEPWTCECSKVMLLTYDNITAAQHELNEIAKPLGAFVDGWGTFGNADE